jgi:hypothetical protein
LKIFEIFNELAKNSEIIAGKLFQIMFNIRNFIETETLSKGGLNSDKTNQLTKKFKKLMIIEQKNGDNPTTANNLAFDCYLKLSKLKHYSEYSQILYNGRLQLNYFIFLNTMLKKILDTAKDTLDKENTCLEKLKNNLLNNIGILLNIFNSDKYKKKLDPDDELLLCDITLNIFSLINVFSRVYMFEENNISESVKQLLDLLVNTFWPACSFVKSKSCRNLDEITLANFGNTLATSQLLLQLLGKTQASMVKKEMFSFFKSEHFLQFISLIMIETSNLTHDSLAHEIFVSLNELGKVNQQVFSLDNFLGLKQKVKSELLKQENDNVITQVKYPHSASFLNNNVDYNKDNAAFNKKNSKDTRLTKLFDFYDYKMKEQSRQLTQMINTLNESFSKNLITEVESQKLRDELKGSIQNEEQLKRDLDSSKEKLRDFEIKYGQMSKSFDSLKQDLVEKNGKLDIKTTKLETTLEKMAICENKLVELNHTCSNLTNESKKYKEECERLKISLEESISSNSITVENLQRVLSSETNSKKEVQLKFQKLKKQMTEIEEVNAKNEQLKLDSQKSFNEKCSEFDKLKTEYDKIQTVLSYIKANT